jgi:hypothetical protein
MRQMMAKPKANRAGRDNLTLIELSRYPGLGGTGQGLGTISYLLAMVRHLASADGDPE